MGYEKNINYYMLQLIELDKSARAYGIDMNVMNYFKIGVYSNRFVEPKKLPEVWEQVFNDTKETLEWKIEQVCKGK